MTNEEAIMWQKLNFLVDSGGDTCETYFEAQKMAIEALEKQTPKKLRLTTSQKMCSSCGKQITSIGCTKPRYNYCKYCGQRIDWSEEDDE